MPPKPMPPANQDPAVIEAQNIQQNYPGNVTAVLNDFSLSDIERGIRVVKLWQATRGRLAELRQDIDQRLRARLDWLHDRLPVGPAIPADASPADKAVLQQAFRAALQAAREASPRQREVMLSEAERFGDDVTRRAVLTVCFDDSQTTTVDKWADAHDPEAGALIKEWRELRMYPQSTDAAFLGLAFKALPRPQEVFTLPALINAHNAAAQQYNRSAGRPAGAPVRPLIEMPDLT